MSPFRRPRLLTAVGVAVTLAVGALAVLAVVPLHRPAPPAVAEARLLFTGPDGLSTPSGDDIATQAALVRSGAVLRSVAQRQGVDSEDALAVLRAGLTAAPDPAAPRSFLVVRYAHPDADEARRTLAYVVEVYLERRRQVLHRDWAEARREAEMSLEEAGQRLSSLRRQAAVYRSDEARAGTVEAAAQKLAALSVRRAEVRAALTWVEKAANDPATKPAAALKAAEWAAKSGYDRLPVEVRGKAEPVAAYTTALKAELGEIDTTRVALDDLIQAQRKAGADAESVEPPHLRAEIDQAERKAAAARVELDRLGTDPARGHFKVVEIDRPRIVR